MFLPLRITHIYERRPIATFTLIVVNVVIFLWVLLAVRDAPRDYLLDPEHLQPIQFLTSVFLHQDIGHLLGNMLFLWVYGSYVEDRLGPWKFLGLYLACGLAGGLLYLAVGSPLPCLGASGAVAGLMGFVFVAAPWSDVRMLFLLDYRQFSDPNFKAHWGIPVWCTLGLWLFFQGLLAWQGGTHIAVAAHLGGFALGAAAAAYMRSEKRRGTSWYLEPATSEGGPAAMRRLKKARGAPRKARPETGPVPSSSVLVLGLSEEASPVALIKLLMRWCAMAPEVAKAHVDLIRAGEAQELACSSEAAADRLRSEARALGAQLAEPT